MRPVLRLASRPVSRLAPRLASRLALRPALPDRPLVPFGFAVIARPALLVG